MYVAMHFAAAAQVLLWFEVQLLASSRQLLALHGGTYFHWPPRRAKS